MRYFVLQPAWPLCTTMDDKSLLPFRLARTRIMKLARLARAPVYWPSALKGVVASVEHAHIPFSHEFGTILDVGASRGQFALFAAHHFPSARIICFEPLPNSQKILREVLGDRIELVAAAAGAEAGAAVVNVSAQDDSSSLLPIGPRQVAEFPGTQRIGSTEVEVRLLADVLTPELPAPRLLKVDVQGLELDVLSGAGEALGLIDEVFVECSFAELYEGQALADEVIAFMLERGLRLVHVAGMVHGTDGAALQADLLFRRRPSDRVAVPAAARLGARDVPNI